MLQDLQPGLTNTDAPGKGHSLEEYVDDETLVAFNAMVEHRKQVTRSNTKLTEDTAVGGGEAAVATDVAVSAGTAALEGVAGFVAAPEVAVLVPLGLAVGGAVVGAEEAVDAAEKTKKDIEEMWKRIRDPQPGE